MLTQNYYNMIANMIGSGGSNDSADLRKNALLYIDCLGRPIRGTYAFRAFPYTFSSTPRLAGYGDAGISVGTDGTPATIKDTNLGSTITSGISMSIASTSHGCDEPGMPYVEYKLSITITGSDPITIREIGYKQGFAGVVNTNESSTSAYTVLMDRTVLETPITIQAGDSGVIDYKLQTLPVERSKNGVRLVSWTYGSDEDVAAMIDAAQQGLIDLQTDADWRVGEFRTIHVDAWTGGGNTSHAESDIRIMISQFGDYNECGSVLQFDFYDVVGETQRMNSSNTNVGGYGATEMYTTTLPALVEALPTWLKSRLKTFSVVATEGNQSTTLETIANNKLALRSSSEVFKNRASIAEGSEVKTYENAPDSQGGTRQKTQTHDSSGRSWWLRSPAISSSSSFYAVQGSGDYFTSWAAANNYFLSPLGCL